MFVSIAASLFCAASSFNVANALGVIGCILSSTSSSSGCSSSSESTDVPEELARYLKSIKASEIIKNI